MDMNPQRVRSAQFKTVKRGLDPDEVQEFLASVADELERAQNQSTAMEARARAAVARLQELSDGAAAQPTRVDPARPGEPVDAPDGSGPQVGATSDQSETISRTLLLAQRTADTAVAEAKAEAQRLRDDAETESAAAAESSRATAEKMLEDARTEARKAGEEEKVALAGEVDSLMARRDFLESDVDHMEQFLVAQRSRLRDAANEIIELTERVPSGLGESRPPLLSAATDDVPTASQAASDGDASADSDADSELAAPGDDDDLWKSDDADDASAEATTATETGTEADADADADGPSAGSGTTLKFGFPRSTD